MGWLSKLIGKGEEASDDPLVVVPIPPLATLLQHHETTKGAPLTEEEVLAIRDNAVCMTTRRSHADQLVEKRGWVDVDAANPWEDWGKDRS